MRMPRATRYLVDGYLYHLTHRCADGEFFLRFAKERDAYREWLRVGAERYKVSVLGYTVTCNHTHVVCEVRDRLAVADMMKLAAGSVAQQRNWRKAHEGSVWEHPYHCTRIEDGQHLLNCLRYVDLNMVRAGKNKHPSEWRWCGYDELTGQRQRYRIVNQERLLLLTGFSSMPEFAAFYRASIAERLASTDRVREPCWTDAVAVGSEEFVDAAVKTTTYRRHMDRYEVCGQSGNKTWAVRESSVSFDANTAPESIR